MSHYLTREVAADAFKLVRPSIEQLLFRSSYPKRKCMHLVVLNPTVRYDAISRVSLESAILFEESINRNDWGEHRFDQFARAKAFLSYRTRLPSQRVQQEFPHLLEPGDVKYGGSVIYQGIIAAASGVQPYFDALCATWLATACHALATYAFQPLLASEEAWVPAA